MQTHTGNRAAASRQTQEVYDLRLQMFKRRIRHVKVFFVLRYKRDPQGIPALVPHRGYWGRASEYAASADSPAAQCSATSRRLITR